MPGNRILLIVALALSLAAIVQARGPGFESKHRLEDEFEKHAREFGPITLRQYVQLAQQLRGARPGSQVLEYRRRDGVIVKFDRKRGYFGTYDRDGTIRRFLIPADGVAYFERWSKRAAVPEGNAKE